jgi:hypothetical protein
MGLMRFDLGTAEVFGLMIACGVSTRSTFFGKSFWTVP